MKKERRAGSASAAVISRCSTTSFAMSLIERRPSIIDIKNAWMRVAAAWLRNASLGGTGSVPRTSHSGRRASMAEMRAGRIPSTASGVTRRAWHTRRTLAPPRGQLPEPLGLSA